MKRYQDVDKTEALWALGLVLREQLPAAALRAISEGNVSTSMQQLAGATSAELDEAPLLFQRALTELGRRPSTKDEALSTLGCCITRDIVQGRIDAYEGAKLLWRAKVESASNDHELDPFVYAVSEYEDRPSDREFFRQAIVREAEDYLKAHCA